MHLFYTPHINLNLPEYMLGEEESAHCIKVLRLKKGDTVYLTDGQGALCEAHIVNDNTKKCLVRIASITFVEKRPFHLHLAVAPTKNIARYEWFLEKATEIGVDEITPLICQHSERDIVKVDRLNKVITAAVKQSLKAFHPILNKPKKFSEFISQATETKKYIAVCPPEKTVPLKSLYQKRNNALILIGPEGDFSKEEIELAKNKNFEFVSLGESRLRTETAAIVACHTINLLNE